MFSKLDLPKMSLGRVAYLIDHETQKKSKSVKRFLDVDTQKKLLLAEREYKRSEDKYDELSEEDSVGVFSKKDAKLVYKNRFNTVVRPEFLDQYQTEACPICGVAFPQELDHVLPKSKYAQFTVTPINLVPMCGNCNHEKLASKVSFHPYFEDFSDLRGLEFRFDFKSKAIVSICFSDGTDDKLKNIMDVYKQKRQLALSANRLLKRIINSISMSENKLNLENIGKVIESGESYGGLEVWEKKFYKNLREITDEFYTFLCNEANKGNE
ncbi:HNH endonuclease [Levilactobacillus brevis]|uniref:HNH endonuclease n=1 Tax=Levilactobacillus brevis TaxID=1580 RepID=UPI00111B2BEF|nr:HNH endonuclease [Levilactobacillus brevis]QCZ46802.1 Hypothetical protein UCCLB556_1925 [Levilactobacillus brevis]